MKNLVVNLGGGIKLKIPKRTIDMAKARDNTGLLHTSGAPFTKDAIKQFRKMRDGELCMTRFPSGHPLDIPGLEVKILKKDGFVERIEFL
jgi:hypothetical protein